MQESSISEKIKELRTDLKMNQKNFSAAIGIRQSTLSSYENGVVTPSNDVLLTIAQKFHVSLDWLFGLSENKVQISTLSDILWVLLQMNESNELRYELDINNKLPGDIETETQKWYAGLRFYGNDPEHSLNARYSISLSVEGSETLLRDALPLNALRPMLTTPSGITTFATVERLRNAFSPILTTGRPRRELGIVNSPPS